MSMRERCFCLVLLFLFMGNASAAKLESIVVQNSSGKSSVFFTYTGIMTHKPFILNHPERIVIDFDEAAKSALNVRNIALGNSPIAAIRSGYPRPNAVRIVFDMKQAVSIRTSTSRNGLRVDIIEKMGRPKAVTVTKQIQTQPQPSKPQVNVGKVPISQKPVSIQRSTPRSLRDVVVVLDPGHGGKDPGAIGPRRIAEKNVTLAIARKLKQLIDKQPGMHAVLTRNGDYYVGLRERLNIARHYNADIFISIHADAFINKQSTGASVFALSQTGATSEAARWLAEKENYSELGGVKLSSLNDQNGLVRTVLLDLSQTATIAASVRMGTQVLHNIDKVTNLHNQVVEQARFVVLKSPDIPSILVETGFITNPREESNLSNPSYQMRMTQAIFAGLKRYFWDTPPHGTRLEVMSSANVRSLRPRASKV